MLSYVCCHTSLRGALILVVQHIFSFFALSLLIFLILRSTLAGPLKVNSIKRNKDYPHLGGK
jgi:hypothetical protein